LACRHEFALSAMKETHYLFPPSVANLVTWATSGCRGLPRALGYLGELESSGIVNRVRQYGLLAAAIDLVQWASETRIGHVHGHSCANSAHVLALAHRLGGPSYSLTLHGDLDVYEGDHRSKMKDAAFICAVGSHLVRQIQEKANITNVIVTSMGVKTVELAKLGKDRSYIAGQLHVVTVARLHPAKGHLQALGAVNRAHRSGLKIHYTIAGEGPHNDTIVSKIRGLGLENQVTLSGSLSENEVYQLLSKADAFLLPSTGLGEAWPVSVMEAMGAGLPVIASVIGATSEMITTGENGFLVPQRDEEALFSKIMLLGADLEIRRRIGTAARCTASQRFDVSMTANVLRGAVQRALRADSKPS
jgi:colanic acid/amylovoran biosynthesis glycosyltransferase